MSTQLSDTHPVIERIMIDGYRRMSPWDKLLRVASLNRALDTLVQARLQATHGPELDPHEAQLRSASLRIERKTMVAAFGWDCQEKGF